MSLLQDLYRGKTAFDFVGLRRRWFALSSVIILLSVVGFTLRGGFDLSIEFRGGTVVEAENRSRVSITEVRDAVTALGITGSRVQLTAGGEGVRVQTGQLSPGEEERPGTRLAADLGVDPVDTSRQSVGPTFGGQVTESAIRALLVFFVVAVLYITWRLEMKMALVALVALAHDLIFTGGIYAIAGFAVSPATVIAILTIMGYSLYDTVVVFDKVLENVKERGERATFSSIVNMSMNQVLMRSVNTSLTTLLPVGSLLFFGSFLLGAATLREFALALFVGVAVGTYSSIFVAAPVLSVWKEREEHWRRVRRRVERKGTEEVFAARAVAPSVPDAAADSLSVAGAVPRPPKQRRKRR